MPILNSHFFETFGTVIAIALSALIILLLVQGFLSSRSKQRRQKRSARNSTE